MGLKDRRDAKAADWLMLRMASFSTSILDWYRCATLLSTVSVYGLPGGSVSTSTCTGRRACTAEEREADEQVPQKQGGGETPNNKSRQVNWGQWAAPAPHLWVLQRAWEGVQRSQLLDVELGQHEIPTQLKNKHVNNERLNTGKLQRTFKRPQACIANCNKIALQYSHLPPGQFTYEA